MELKLLMERKASEWHTDKIKHFILMASQNLCTAETERTEKH
jgi:hypothetical protein